MKDIKDYVRESILDDIDDQIENTDEMIKKSVTKWIMKNTLNATNRHKLDFDLSTTPMTVNCHATVYIKEKATSLTNGAFQWGKIHGDFDCVDCNIFTLEGGPQYVGGDFDCAGCKNLKSLEGAPKEVRYDFYCYGCHTKFTEDDVKKLCNVRGTIHCK